MRALTITAVLVVAAVAAVGAETPKAGPTPVPVTDATVVARVSGIARKQDHQALADYYRAKTQAAVPAIEAQEKLLRAYLSLDQKKFHDLADDARSLLRAARLTKKHYELLAVTHQRIVWEWDD